MVSEYILPNKSLQYSQIEIFILNISFSYYSSTMLHLFYTYLIVSKPFRHDFKQLIMNVYRKLRRQPT